MATSLNNLNQLLRELQERKKELNCLYQVEEIIHLGEKKKKSVSAVLTELVRTIPSGFQYTDAAQALISLDNKFFPEDISLPHSDVIQSEGILVNGQEKGRIYVWYKSELPQSEPDLFLKEELRMLRNIADRLAHFISHRDYSSMQSQWNLMEKKIDQENPQVWKAIIEMLQWSDKNLYQSIARKMLYFLCWNGVREAREILEKSVKERSAVHNQPAGENIPIRKHSPEPQNPFIETIFDIAIRHLSDEMILDQIQKWINEEKPRTLYKILESPNSSLRDIINTVTRFQLLEQEGMRVSQPVSIGIRVALIRKLFSDQLDFINTAKNHIPIKGYYELVKRIIHPQDSHGQLGGKSSGLFLAEQILEKNKSSYPELADIRTPKTWYISSDSMLNFIYYNNLEFIIEQKYKDPDEIQVEYPNIIQLFKNAHFPPEIRQGLSLALDEIGDRPIIIRSSSLLEDRSGASFSGKYKSLFLANQGDKQKKLEAVTDAIAEVYASVFSPDPLAYRATQGLLDFNEEMGIMLQEVVGQKVGRYYFPAFSGVAFSRNEFRWSRRIRSEDGLIRMVPGLGTRAVDRTADDYPTLIAPRKAELRVNVSMEERIRYAARYMDLIDLNQNTFETLPIGEILKNHGAEMPLTEMICSEVSENMLISPTSRFNMDFEKKEYIVTFERLFKETPIIKTIASTLDVLEKNIGAPVDLEFSHDGRHLYLLQCRPQAHNQDLLPAHIPLDIPEDRVIFRANRHISNGFIPDISHVVYVDPDAYQKLSTLDEHKEIGTAIGKLNKLLPKKSFILIGPGRWGSRGDIKLGVSVSYSDINKTAALIEIAQKKGHYVPELSFGTHFFQDLVEASIRYIPLYLDNDEASLNWSFFTDNTNYLGEILPDFAHLGQTIRLIDVKKSTGDSGIRILMNADKEQAIAYLVNKDASPQPVMETSRSASMPQYRDEYWIWRKHMAQRVVDHMHPEEQGIEAVYLFGSTKNATAGPGSDIDLLVHFRGSPKQRRDLENWLTGWSQALGEINHLKTGEPSQNLLDVHIISDEDIAKKTSYAVKINAATDAATLLPLPHRRKR